MRYRKHVAPGYQPFIIVDKPAAYADLIDAINGSKPIACMTLTSADRKAKDIKGVRKEIINEWIAKSLAPAINRLNICDMYLVCDKSRSVIDIHHMPTASAKYISLLDNPIWQSFRETVRKQHSLTTSNLPSILSRAFFIVKR